MDKSLIYNNLTTKTLARKIEVYDTIDSTQTELKRRKEVYDGLLIIAESQTNGSGTHGRKWYTETKNKNIAMSFVLIPNDNIAKFDTLTILIAKCIVKAFKSIYNIDLKIKHPNDIVYNKKKIGGILTQTSLKGEIVSEIFVGIGINVLQEDFNDEIKDIASSIYNEFNIKCNREKIIAEFFNIFEPEYIKLMEETYE